MSNSTSPKATRKGGWARKLGIIAAALFLLLVIGWFVITSGAFFKSFILPRVGTAMNAQITVENVSLSPFSSITLRKLVVHPNGADPLFQADEIRARYSLWSILGGNIVVDEVVVDAPKLTIVQNADGTSNLDPLMKSAKAPPPKQDKSAKPSAPPQVNVKSMAIKNGSVRVTQHARVGADQVTEVSGFNFSLADLKNGGTAKLDLGATLSLTKPGAANATATTLAATLKSALQVAFDANLQPQTVRGDTEFAVTQATGDLKDSATVTAKLTTEISPTEVKQLSLAFTKAGQGIGSLQVSGPFNLAKLEGKLTVSVASIDLTDWRAFTGTNVRSGIISADVDLLSQQAGKKLAFTVSTKASGLGADFGATQLDQGSLALSLRGTLDDFQKLSLTACTATVARAAQEVATLKVSGTADLKSLDVDLQTALNASLPEAAALAAQPGVRFTAGTLQFSGTVKQQNQSPSVKGSLKLTPLSGTAAGLTLDRLEAALDCDLAMKNQMLDLRQCRLALAPTTRGTNVVNLTGKVDLTQTNAITGALKLAADSLDATTYYDLFTGGPAKPATTTPTTTKPAAASPEVEPAPVQLPFKNFVVEAAIGRFYLREVEITNLQATLKLDGGHVVAKPLKLGLNGVPVSASADVDLGVPGYNYNISLNAPGILLAPLVNSFMPERKGQVSGTLTAAAQLKGAGITGASLQKNLAGQFGLASTNLNLAIANLRSPIMLGVINVIIAIPDGIKNPGATVGSLLGRLRGESRSSGGWTDEITKSPINAIVVRGTAGGGKIELTQALVESPAFQVNAAGTIGLTAVLNDSKLSFPVMVSLNRGLSDKVGLTPTNTPTNAVYARLPDFVTVKGTLGSPEIKKDYLVLAQVALKAGGGVLGRAGGAVAGQAGSLVEKLGNLLNGQPLQPAATNATAQTNQPAAAPTNQPAPFNLRNLLNPPKDTNRVADPNKPAKK